jgi:hypothetical protein
LSQYKNLFHHYIHQHSEDKASTFWGACGAIRKDIFIALGGFDENYVKPSIEDIELGYRLQMKGHHIRLLKSLQVKHLKQWGVLSLLKSDIFHRGIPWTKLILRTGMLVNDLNLKISHRISIILTYGLLGALMGLPVWSGFLLIAGALFLSLILLNVEMYRFFLRKRGPWFAFRSLLWHWFYYWYSGVAFAAGMLAHFLDKCFVSGKISREAPNG